MIGICDEGRRVFRKKCGAYMTIEASFIVPMTVMICVLIITFMFFMYNNCVVYQSCYIAALRGSQIMDATSSDVKARVKAYATELLDNQIYQYNKAADIEVGPLSVTVSSGTGIDIPASVLSLYKNTTVSSERKAICSRIDPTELVRAKN